MNPRRPATITAVLCGMGGVAWFAGFGSGGIENTMTPTLDRLALFLTAHFELTDAPQPTAMGNAGIGNVDVAKAAELVRGTPTDRTAASAIVEAALTNSSQMQPPETPPVQPATASTPNAIPRDSEDAVSLADVPRPTDVDNAGITNVDVARAPELVRETPADGTAASDVRKSIVEAALTSTSQMLPPETPPAQVAKAAAPNAMPRDTEDALSSIKILDECLGTEICIDRYLWALYQRTPKEDTIKVEERRKVTVRNKDQTVTVTKSFIKFVDEDFAWKDPKAAEKAGMPTPDYAIGGMDPSFKLKLFHMLHAAEEVGLSPGITSAFRDDYRQSIASGLKAAADRSYHGGSFRGGYGHGLAADVVSVNGETRMQRSISTENLWKWIDAHEKEFGLGRPYLDKDPAHVAPIDGKEYATHRRTKALYVVSDVKEHKAVGNNGSVAKRARLSSPL
jgi:hypothetical protein